MSGNYNESLMRQWLLIKNMPHHSRGKTVKEFQAILEKEGYRDESAVTPRTIERNLDSLSRIFSITHDDNRPQRWHWMETPTTFILPTLSTSQALALSLAKKHLGQLLPIKQMKELETIFKNADSVLEEESVKLSKEWQKKVAIIPANQPLFPPKYQDGVLDAVYEALFHEKQIEVIYHSKRSQEKAERTLNPLGLYQRASNIYLVASISEEGKARNWALHRILKAKVLEEKIKKPKDFSLEKFIESGATQFYGTGKPIKLELRLKAWLASDLQETPLSKDQKLIQEDEKHYRLKATVLEYEQLRWWLQSLGNSVEVLKPLKLRKEIIGVLKETLEQYNL